MDGSNPPGAGLERNPAHLRNLRILLSEDICMLNHLKYTGGKGYGYLLEIFVPLLRQRGVTDEQIHQMMVVNPANAFSRRRRDSCIS